LGDLAFIDVATSEIQRITYPGIGIGLYKLSPDGSRIAFSVPKRLEKPGSQQVLFDLVAFDVPGRKSHVIASDVRLYLGGRHFSWSPDSTRLAYLTAALSVDPEGFVIDVRSGKSTKVVSSSVSRGYSFQGLLWDKTGRNLYFSSGGTLWRTSETANDASEVASIADHTVGIVASGANLDEFRNADLIWSLDKDRSTIVVTRDQQTKKCGYYRINLESGVSEKILEEDKVYGTGPCNADGLNVSPDGKTLVYVAEDAGHERELWAIDSEFRNSKRLTHLKADLYGYEFGKSQLVEWRALDGQLQKGALLLPAGYKQGQQYPLLVQVYGGALLSENVNTFDYSWPIVGPGSMQLFATRGYAVLAPDAPWKTGTPMADLLKTVLPGVDKVVELGIADPSRIGVFGHSFGGFSTLALIVQTTRFKAAIMSAGFGDQMCAYAGMKPDGTARGIAIAERMLIGGTPWGYRSRYIENSPIFYLDRVTTPLLILHGTADNAVPPYCADEVFVALRRLGKAVEYAKYAGEDHVPQYWTDANRIDYINRMLAWFDDHLKKPADATPVIQKPN
jgi:dipeptidyl aminopeptidase/acylaminoacyl peptidase